MSKSLALLRLSALLLVSISIPTMAEAPSFVFEAGDPSLKSWLLPEEIPHPEVNSPNPARVLLGKTLYFDPRLSSTGNMSCATCHNPGLGWSDGLGVSRGRDGVQLERASPTLFNNAYNSFQMWDGRKRTIEEQALLPLTAEHEMNMLTEKIFSWLGNNTEYRKMFQSAYPGEEVNESTFSKALAAYQRTIVSRNSPFDRWVKGDATAMSKAQVNGFRLFVGKANCAACHMDGNFTDNGFHNIGLASFDKDSPDLGRFKVTPVASMKGAFKTPTVREVEQTAPYFHDGSAKTLMEVVEHYNIGGVAKTNLSPNIRPLHLTEQEKIELVEFMKALSSPFLAVTTPDLPRDNPPKIK